MIDTKTQEIRPQDQDTYTDLLELADELPDSSPRFILLSYPLTLVCRFHVLNPHPLVDGLHPLAIRTSMSGAARLPSSQFADDKQASGRQSVPYVLLYYLPVNANPNLKMSYAGAVELMRGTAEVNRVIEISETEELEGIEAKLKGED